MCLRKTLKLSLDKDGECLTYMYSVNNANFACAHTLYRDVRVLVRLLFVM